MKDEQTWKVWSDDLAELLKILLLHSLQIPQKLAAATKSQITLLRLQKEFRLHEDPKKFFKELHLP